MAKVILPASIGDGEHVWIKDGSGLKPAVAMNYGDGSDPDFMRLGQDWYSPLEPDETIHAHLEEPLA